MNTTESGSIAVGAPMSLARLQQEINHYCLPGDGKLEAFARTPEGKELLQRYVRWVGGYDPDGDMVEFIKGQNGGIEIERIQYMLYGALFALEYTMYGRVPSTKPNHPGPAGHN